MEYLRKRDLEFPGWEGPTEDTVVVEIQRRDTVLIYERENKPCFSLELSNIQFTNYSLHIVDPFHISCHDISKAITSLVTRKTHIYSNTMCRALVLIIARVYRHLTVF
jgi:hypothetical protein